MRTCAMRSHGMGGFEPLPTEEHVAVCTIDGQDARCFGGEVRERVIRCRECSLSGTDAHGGMTCDRWPMSRHDTTPDGFCSWAIGKGD